MHVSESALQRVILDFEKYPEFLPEVMEARPREARGGLQVVDFEIELIKRFQYTLEFDLQNPSHLKWRLLESNFFTSNEGAWILKSQGENLTQATYELEVGVRFLIPGWISKKLTEVNLPKVLEHFEARAKSLAKKG